MTATYLVVYEKSATGWGAYVPDLPGLGVVAATQAAVKSLIREGVALHLEGLKQDGIPAPPPSTQSDYISVSA